MSRSRAKIGIGSPSAAPHCRAAAASCVRSRASADISESCTGCRVSCDRSSEYPEDVTRGSVEGEEDVEAIAPPAPTGVMLREDRPWLAEARLSPQAVVGEIEAAESVLFEGGRSIAGFPDRHLGQQFHRLDKVVCV
mmetsp:Transcript_18197/g.63964  ORF Transcript_18197/g.63964 Transcript_18197/m.63964 type:complete len:137 (-) Transcript_18197:22-432(-)